MIHFFPIFSRNAANTEFGLALARIGASHRIFAGEVRFNYRSRLELLLVCLPRLAWFATRSAIRSLFLARPFPQAVVVGSDIEVLVFALARLLRLRRTRIVLSSFIYTQRAAGWQNALRRRLFAFVLARADAIVVHSRLEQARYGALFPRSAGRFAFIPWGTTIDARARLMGGADCLPGEPGRVVAAGKSGRDWDTLLEAVRGQDLHLRLVCDCFPDEARLAALPNVTLLARCHGEDYLREIGDAAVVAVPLATADISAGQMVMIQAMGLGKALVVTDTPTIRDYVSEAEAVLVPMGDAIAWREAIHRLMQDEAARARLGRAAAARFDAACSTEAHLRRLIALAGRENPA